MMKKKIFQNNTFFYQKNVLFPVIFHNFLLYQQKVIKNVELLRNKKIIKQKI